jgi:hypothetical protein
MRAPILWLSLAALAGCAGADPPQRTTSTLTCAGGVACTLELAEAGGFTIELVSSDCVAVETTVRLTAPAAVAQTLMSDACRETAGRVWDFSPPDNVFPAGTEINMEVTADQFANPPELEVTGDQVWTIRYEDGFDVDFDDLILVVTAVPAT